MAEKPKDCIHVRISFTGEWEIKIIYDTLGTWQLKVELKHKKCFKNFSYSGS